MLKLHTFHNDFTGQTYVPVALTCKRTYLTKQQDGFLFLRRNFITYVKEIFGLSGSGIFICFFFSARFFVTFRESTSLLFSDLRPGNSLSIVSYDILSFGARVGNWNLWTATVVLRASLYNYSVIFVHANFAGFEKFFCLFWKLYYKLLYVGSIPQKIPISFNFYLNYGSFFL